MLHRILEYFLGYLIICISGNKKEYMIECCKRNRIFLSKLKVNNRGIYGQVSLPDFFRLCKLKKGKDVKIKIIKRCGFLFFIRKNYKRRYLLISSVSLFILLYALSFRLWDISFLGNVYYSDESLRELILSKGINYGMRVKDIDCEVLKQNIRDSFDKIVWVSVQKKGLRLIVHVTEEHGRIDEQAVNLTDGNLVAATDGIIKEMIVRSGVPKVSIGDTVKKGDILVSNEVPLQNDSKEVYDTFHVSPDATIILETVIDYKDVVYRNKKVSVVTKTKNKVSFSIFGKTFTPFYKKSTDYENQRIIRTYYQLVLYDNCKLPVKLNKLTIKKLEKQELVLTDALLDEALSQNFEVFCEKLSKKGIQILSNNVKISKDMQKAEAIGTITVLVPAF